MGIAILSNLGVCGQTTQLRGHRLTRSRTKPACSTPHIVKDFAIVEAAVFFGVTEQVPDGQSWETTLTKEIA
jgi:hypothetical protein